MIAEGIVSLRQVMHVYFTWYHCVLTGTLSIYIYELCEFSTFAMTSTTPTATCEDYVTVATNDTISTLAATLSSVSLY